MRKHSIAAKLAILIVALASLAAVGASTAQAWPVDPHVILNGSITCPGLYGDDVQWAWVSASDGESGWASLGSGGRTRGYSFNLWRVPYGQPGTYVTITVGCAATGQHSTGFWVNRPKLGNYQTRNLTWWV